MKRSLVFLAAAALLPVLSAAETETGAAVEVVAASPDRQWTGVAVGNSGRLFVNYPYWSNTVPVSVAEIRDGEVLPWPNSRWNDRKIIPSFQAVQSVVADRLDRLWVVDTNNPLQQGVQSDGPVLYCFNLKDDRLLDRYTFPAAAYDKNSYYNDVRIDEDRNYAYLTDSGSGGLIVLNLASREARRVLHDHPSVKAETDQLICDGMVWKGTVHSDGIALTPDREYLYYAALSGHTLYRIRTAPLRDFSLSEAELGNAVEKVGRIPATDGMLFDREGRLWLGGLEENAVNLRLADGRIVQAARSPKIRWADSFAMDREGNLYFTTSQLHVPADLRAAYTVMKLRYDK